MTIKDFGNNFDMTLLQRGYDYFTSGSIDNMEKSDNGLWLAEVQGSEIYSVEVEVRRKRLGI